MVLTGNYKEHDLIGEIVRSFIDIISVQSTEELILK